MKKNKRMKADKLQAALMQYIKFKHQYHKCNNVVPQVTQCRDLGVVMTSSLSPTADMRVATPHQPQTLHHESQSGPNLYVTAFTTVILFFSLNKKYA